MPKVEVTQVCGEEIQELSGSAMELGNDAGAFTWGNCLEAAERFGKDLGLDYDDVRDHFAEYGAWNEEERDTWSERDMQAMVIQETAARLREIEDPNWTNEHEDEPGLACGNLYVGADGRAWLYLGV